MISSSRLIMKYMKQTQKKFIIDSLVKNGFVSRNTCLKRYISRLGAYIQSLKDTGWKIKGYYQDTERGRDYVYTLIK